LNNKERLLETLSGAGKRELPVICPGGMVAMACREVGETNRAKWQEGHTRPEVMARLAQVLRQATGFENLGVPFCITVEAEAMGGRVDFGSADVEPRMVDYILDGTDKLERLKNADPQSSGRMPVVLEAIARLKGENADTPVIGNLTGPISLATSLMDVNPFMRSMIKDKPFVRELMARSTEVIATFGEAQIRAGADVISIGDPTASGEILGPEYFGEFVSPCLKTIISRLKKHGVPVILHICGHITSILGLLRATGADALSFDANIPIKEARNKVGDWPLMGNVSTFTLALGARDAVAEATRRVINEGVDIVAPACGLGSGTPMANVRAMTNTVRAARRKSLP
jgi:[methyl-Co(III) methanol-specific corrinoid protein]:coenzyme M methyltransferase